MCERSPALKGLFRHLAAVRITAVRARVWGSATKRILKGMSGGHRTFYRSERVCLNVSVPCDSARLGFPGTQRTNHQTDEKSPVENEAIRSRPMP